MENLISIATSHTNSFFKKNHEKTYTELNEQKTLITDLQFIETKLKGQESILRNASMIEFQKNYTNLVLAST